MCGLNQRYEAAAVAIDRANELDPNLVRVRGQELPLALAHGQYATEWVTALHPDADPLLLLAARAHHLRRWELPRSQYPEGKAGYLRWKRDQRQRHATDVAALLTPLGFTDDEVAQVQSWVRRDQLATDPGSQAMEDAACLVFIETQLADVAAKLDHDHLIDVIRKTAKKMSPAALAAVARIPLGEAERQLLAAALASPSA
ncbi:MAG: DUF4202 domain-containing protein [Actinobacteria bacterium]|nr:DUF4202 domain-containing protein [Actinomycetota bacterium]